MPRNSHFRAGVEEGLDSALTERMESWAGILQGREMTSERTGLREAARSAGRRWSSRRRIWRPPAGDKSPKEENEENNDSRKGLYFTRSGREN